MTDTNDTRPHMPLGLAQRGYTGVIQHLSAREAGSALSDIELESRLIELGFVEGAPEGWVGYWAATLSGWGAMARLLK